MALTDLTQGDFEYYKKYAEKMRTCHEEEFMSRIDPELMRAYYRGFNKKMKEQNTNEQGFYNKREHYLTLTRIFTGTNTILPNLYYQNPKPIAIPTANTSKQSASLMKSIIQYYMKENNAKAENQEAVLNGWFYGIGWKKIGYQTTFAPRVQEPETQGVIEKLKQGIQDALGHKPDNNESRERPLPVDYEGLFNTSESPLNIMVDHKADLRNCRAILHRMKRTLYDLQNFGNYDEGAIQEVLEKMQHERGSRMDSRDIDLDLNELHVLQRNGVWIVTWVDQFNKPFRYDQSNYQGKKFLFSPIVFTNEPGVRYPTSHLRVASQVQENIDYLSTLFIRIIDKVRNQVIINKNALAPGMDKAILANKTGGVIFTNQDISPGTFAQLTSAAVQNDIPLMLQILQQNITEIMGADEQLITGASKNKTFGQDRLARIGTQVRESGMLDKVREWMIDQFNKESILLQQFSNAQLYLQIDPEDMIDQQTQMPNKPRWESFMTEQNPLGAKHYLQGKFEFDLNIYEAVKPDKQELQKEYADAMVLFSNPNVQSSMLNNGAMPRLDRLAEAYGKNFELINANDFVERLNPIQVAAYKAEKAMEAQGGMMPPKPTGSEGQGKPKEEQATPQKMPVDIGA